MKQRLIALAQEKKTPFYYYDIGLLNRTIAQLIEDSKVFSVPVHIHYALKANTNLKLLQLIQKNGLGADCVSGGEIMDAIEAGFSPKEIVFAGVGKADWEIELALKNNIFAFNVESIEEIEVIGELAKKNGRVAQLALRINPQLKVHTHANIATGQAENKFGIPIRDLESCLEAIGQSSSVDLIGLHFHIGSQILLMDDFIQLASRVNEILVFLENKNIYIKHLNLGGGLGIDYKTPDCHPIADFTSYFRVFQEHLAIRSYQELHFELGRSVIAQCGNLITKVLYTKRGIDRDFLILDAGMTDLMRPALYQAQHKIENISSLSCEQKRYDVVGPICESSDVFDRGVELPVTQRGDVIVIRSAGAYGEVMASTYNSRELPKSYFSE